jgi:hypothetical protein
MVTLTARFRPFLRPAVPFSATKGTNGLSRQKMTDGSASWLSLGYPCSIKVKHEQDNLLISLARPTGLEPATYGLEVRGIGFSPTITYRYRDSSLLIISRGCLDFVCHWLIMNDTFRHLYGHQKLLSGRGLYSSFCTRDVGYRSICTYLYIHSDRIEYSFSHSGGAVPCLYYAIYGGRPKHRAWYCSVPLQAEHSGWSHFVGNVHIQQRCAWF